ncbi:MAG: hypothetical protein C5B49_05970 [Bdellovibrio sp.]|nr:MAG: hypothetical protein C5B49_05970 [Bdellovibrio sp.]
MNDILIVTVFLAKVIALSGFFFFMRGLWERFFGNSVSIFAPSEERSITRSWIQYSWGELSRRSWLLRCGISPLDGRVFFLLQTVVIYALCFHGFFMDLNPYLRMESPPEILFWLGEAGGFFVLLVFGCATVLALLPRRPYVVSTLSLVLCFPPILSLAGTLAAIAAERFAIRLAFALMFRRKIKPMDFFPVVAISALSTVFIVLWGRGLFLFLSSVLELRQVSAFGTSAFPLFQATNRFILLGGAHLLLSAGETLALLVFYHFYWRSTKAEQTLDSLPPVSAVKWGWTSDQTTAWIKAKAAARLKSLASLESESKAVLDKVPNTVRERMESEIKEARKILQLN